jgi:hypothetical protein
MYTSLKFEADARPPGRCSTKTRRRVHGACCRQARRSRILRNKPPHLKMRCHPDRSVPGFPAMLHWTGQPSSSTGNPGERSGGICGAPLGVPEFSVTKPPHLKMKCHPDRSVAKWRDLLFPSATNRPSLEAPLSPLSSRPKRTRISCHAALDKAACAPFCKGKAHEAHQRHQVLQEIRGSAVEGSAVHSLSNRRRGKPNPRL